MQLAKCLLCFVFWLLIAIHQPSYLHSCCLSVTEVCDSWFPHLIPSSSETNVVKPTNGQFTWIKFALLMYRIRLWFWINRVTFYEETQRFLKVCMLKPKGLDDFHPSTGRIVEEINFIQKDLLHLTIAAFECSIRVCGWKSSHLTWERV